MTRTEWLDIRNNVEIPITAFYEMFIERTGFDFPLIKFQEMFFLACFEESTIDIGGSVFKKVTYDSCIHNLYTHYDTKFGLRDS